MATAGPSLSVVRTYNSLDPRTSQAFGAGWSSAADMSLDPDPDGTGALILTLADGQQARFAKNASGGYAPPQDLYAVVKALSGGGFSVTDQTGTTYDFAQASGSDWLISGISDDQGQSETFALHQRRADLDHQQRVGAGAAFHLVDAERRVVRARGVGGDRPGHGGEGGDGADLDATATAVTC